MIKVFLLVIAYTMNDGTVRLVIKDAEDKCPTQAEAVRDMEALRETGYVKGWTFWCKETYVITSAPRDS